MYKTTARDRRTKRLAKMYQAGRQARLALRIPRQIVRRNIPTYRRVAPEVKGVDRRFEEELIAHPVNMSSTANIFTLNGIAPGTGSWNRVGRKVYLDSVQLGLDFHIMRPSTDSTSVPSLMDSRRDYVRVVVVYDPSTDGTLPAPNHILATKNAAGNEDSNPYSPRNYDTMNRFITIYDKKHPYNTIKTAASVGSTYDVSGAVYIAICSMYKKIRKYVTFNGEDATVASISTGGLFLLVLPSDHTGSEVLVTMTGYTRIRYLDS